MQINNLNLIFNQFLLFSITDQKDFINIVNTSLNSDKINLINNLNDYFRIEDKNILVPESRIQNFTENLNIILSIITIILSFLQSVLGKSI